MRETSSASIRTVRSRLEVVDVSFSYRRRPVLSNASWTVHDGVTALLGPNGSGKTTLIKCITGVLRCQRGDVLINGQSIRQGAETQQLLGYVPQSATLPGLAKVRDIVAYAAWLSRVPRAREQELVAQALTVMDVEDLADRRIRSLSGGQRQRVALATGIVHDPAVLILDEPTVGLDPGQRLRVRDVIQRVGRTRPVIMSTHMTEDVQHLATAVAVLVGGAIRYHGSVAGLSDSVVRPGGDTRPGSEFEQGYDALMQQFGASE